MDSQRKHKVLVDYEDDDEDQQVSTEDGHKKDGNTSPVEEKTDEKSVKSQERSERLRKKSETRRAEGDRKGHSSRDRYSRHEHKSGSERSGSKRRSRSRSPGKRSSKWSSERSDRREKQRESRRNSSRGGGGEEDHYGSKKRSELSRSGHRKERSHYRERSPGNGKDNNGGQKKLPLSLRHHHRGESESVESEEKKANHSKTQGPARTSTEPVSDSKSSLDQNSSNQPTNVSNVPKYYNPIAVNPVKYIQQEAKKKLLWETSSKPESSSSKLWENLKFSGSQGGQMTEKFRKLMGIKGTKPEAQANPSEAAPEAGPSNVDESVLKKQEAIFRDLDKQYSVARMAAHTHRGIGLGFPSTGSGSN